MAAFKSINVVQPSEEAARRWANTIKREKEAQKQQEQQERKDEQEQEEDQDR
jgi:hypothetical protein